MHAALDTEQEREDRPAAPEQPLAVVDIGSNSGRLLVLRLDPNGHLEVLEERGAPLRLVRDLGKNGKLSQSAIERTLGVLRDFRAVAQGAGARRTVAVATAAVREARNGDALVERVRAELGWEAEIITGEQEARYAFMGAVHSLAIDHGILVDQGGGSMEIVHFRGRQLLRSWLLPLGALRLSDRFLTSDPPTGAEQRRLTDAVREHLTAARIPALAPDEQAVGTGGTIRNLGKIDRRHRSYPLSRLHGYTLTRRNLHAEATLLAGRTSTERAGVPGLNRERVDSVTGGALAMFTVLEHLGASDLLIAGEGLREGVALHALSGRMLPADAVRQASLAAVTARFVAWNPEAAQRRAALAAALTDALEPQAGVEWRDTLAQAAAVLDIGRSVDYYNRHDHTAQIIVAADLEGFT
ncbi:MAG: Ppx/GppA family phosphatase, partial [Chloroflexi bacterium]|nr:Ppx/GppA family phosphatase [Chloroflexota bacterium]